MYPKMLEAIIFLKFNRELWTKFDIADAVSIAKKTNNNEKLEKRRIASCCFNKWMNDFVNIDDF